MRTDRTVATDLWVRRLGADRVPGAPLLVCLPHAGGAASAYTALARAVWPAVDAVAVQYPGRHDRHRERPITDLGRLADLVAEATAAAAGERPMALFGHSMGALLAYEVTRRLPVGAVTHLFVSGRGAPTAMPPATDLIDGDEELLAAVRRLGGTAARVLADPDLVELVLPALRADYTALAGHRWVDGPPLRCPLTILAGDADPVVPLAAARNWRAYTTGRTELRVFHGGHFFMENQWESVAELVVATLTS